VQADIQEEEAAAAAELASARTKAKDLEQQVCALFSNYMTVFKSHNSRLTRVRSSSCIPK
jgi:hypothetical protein